jgi:hypothetical protein
MNIRQPVKEAATIVVGVPLAFIAAAIAAIGLALNWAGVSAAERLYRRH